MEAEYPLEGGGCFLKVIILFHITVLGFFKSMDIF